MDVAAWTSHFPRFHILNTLVEVLKDGVSGQGEDVSQEQLEELLPDLCLALPSSSFTCAQLLHSLPNNSCVWSKLEEALTSKKLLHPEITSVLYLTHPPALERELMHVLGLYAGAKSQGPWWDDETLSIAHFRPHGRLLYASITTREEQGWGDQAEKGVRVGTERNSFRDQAKRKGVREGSEGQSCSRDETKRKVNMWEASPVVEASGHSDELFHRCLSFLGSVLVRTGFSFPAVVASRDFLAQVSTVMKNELYHTFPSHLTHQAYLLSLPLATKQEQDTLKDPPLLLLIENGLRDELALGGEARERVCVMLSFFPFWLPVLRKSGFLQSYLVDGMCDVFSGAKEGWR